MSYFSGQKTFLTGISLFVLLTVSTRPAFAVSTPDFGSCLNPQVAASQINNGKDHGIIGSNTPYSGTDSIYSLQNGNVLQCLCTVEGSGIQTNWIKAVNFSEQEINFYTSQGWTYVPTGALWGLEDVPYLAKNNNYSCKGSEQSSSSSSNGVQASIAAAQASVLGLATTGNAFAIYAFIFLGLISLFAGILLNRSKSK